MTGNAGFRRFIARVEVHNGNIVNGEPTYNVPTDWIVHANMSQLPVRYRGIDPGTYGGEPVHGNQLQSVVTGLIEVLATPRTRSITPVMRFVIAGRVMNIMNIYDKLGEQTDLCIQVKEVQQ